MGARTPFFTFFVYFLEFWETGGTAGVPGDRGYVLTMYQLKWRHLDMFHDIFHDFCIVFLCSIEPEKKAMVRPVTFISEGMLNA